MKASRVLVPGVLGVATAMLPSTGAVAQQQEEQVIEEIVVKGIRGSLRRSLDVKRNAATVVDVVSAEDIGKFPDANVAESLQRITGVAIDRNGGEGQFITVRGLGPEFNTVLVNGRLMATDNEGREFSFDVLSSDIIQRAEVYKTSKPELQEGGIGSTVNIVTAKPFDRPGTGFTFSASGIADTLAEELSPELSGFFNYTNDDRTWGFLAGVSYSDRESQRDFTDLNGWINNPSGEAAIDASADAVGLDESALITIENIHIPRNLNFNRAIQSRERLTANAALQLRPVDTIEITVDGIFSDFDVQSRRNFFAAFFTPVFIDVEFNENRTVTGFNRPGQEFLAANPVLDNGGFVSLSQNDNVVTSSDRFTESYLAGINFEWDISDSFTLESDLSFSGADRQDLNPFVVVGSLATTAPRFDLNPGDDVPQLSNVGDITDPSLQRAHFAQIEELEVEDEISQFRLEGDYLADRGPFLGIKFGGMISNRQKIVLTANTGSEAFCTYCGYTLPMDPSLLRPFALDGFLDDASGAPAPMQFFDFDPFAVLEFLTRPENLRSPLRNPGTANLTPAELEAAAVALESLENGVYGPRARPGESLDVEEEVLSFYFNTSWEGDFGGDLPWSLDVGVRVARTESTSSGFTQEIVSITQPVGDDNLDIVLSPPTPISIENSYTNVLPALNLKVNLADDKILRFGASRTVTRPTLTSLGTDNQFQGRTTAALSSGGNPGLEPFESTNYDLSFEWYFSEVSFFGAAVFHKEFEEFLESQTLPVPRTFIDQFGEEQPIVFQDTRIRNGEEGSISGIELAGQHSFDRLPGIWSGFGVSANYTFVDSGVDRAEGSAAADCDFNGLSPNTFNISGFFENERVQVRLAYNWRDEFLLECFGQQGRPENRSDFGQLDFTASYAINDAFQVFVEGINVLDEDTRDFSVLDERFLIYDDTGSRFTLGVRGAF